MNIEKYKQIFTTLNAKTVFFPVFAAMLCCFYAFKNVAFPLHIFDRGIVSAATMEMLDINQRTGLFWNAVGLGIFTFLVALVIQNFLFIRFKSVTQHISFINGISFFGCIIILHSFLSAEQSFTLGFISYMIGFVWLSALLSIFWEKKYLTEKKHFWHFHFWYIITGFLIYFIINNFNLYLSGKTFRISFIFPFEIAFCTMLGVQIFTHFRKINIATLLKYSFPLLIFVWWNFVSNELNYILNQHSIFSNPLLTVIYGYVVILLFYLLKWKIQRNQPVKTASVQLAYYYLPVLLVIIGCYTYYLPAIPAIRELFETANPANSIMLSCKYGKLPFFEYLNSHALSETFFGYIYVFLNGFNGSLDLFLYDFLHNVIFLLIAYYFLWKLTKNAFLAFAISLLLPFQEIIFCEVFSYSLISVFLLSRMYVNASYKNYILGFVWSFILILWRIDIGYANMLAFLLVSTILIFAHYNHKQFLRFCIALLVVVVSFAFIVIVIVWIKKIDIVAVISQVLHYLSGNQAHGAISVYNEPERLFLMQYCFPNYHIIFFFVYCIAFKTFHQKKYFCNSFHSFSFFFLSVQFSPRYCKTWF